MPAWEFGIGPYIVPGVLQGVEVPDRALNWQITQGALGGIGASTIWRGTKIDEGGIVITTLITDVDGLVIEDADEAARVWGAFLDQVHPQAGTAKPPAWDLRHPLLDAQRPRIQRGAHSKNKMVLFREGSIAWLGSLILIEFKPLKLATPAPPDPAKLSDKEETPQNARQRQIAELIDKVNNKLPDDVI